MEIYGEKLFFSQKFGGIRSFAYFCIQLFDKHVIIHRVMEKIRMLILNILILGVNFSLNAIPLSMASAHVPNFFSYAWFLVLNFYLFIWQDSLFFSLAKQKGMYICFAVCACVTAIISWYPVYYIYIRNEYGVTIYSIFSTLFSLYLDRCRLCCVIYL